MSAIYELHDVTKAYSNGVAPVRAVDDVSLTIQDGEFLVVAGPSGSGKTTLLQLLGCLDRPTSGEIVLHGRNVGSLGDGRLARLRLMTIGFVFQQFNLIPTLTAQENVEVALAPARVRRRGRHVRASGLLARVGLAERARHLPSQLSGGEQQRVAIARALANEPRVLLADEPTGNLDSKTGDDILDLLRSLSEQQGKTVVLVTHDREIAARASRTVVMEDGRVSLRFRDAGDAAAART
jgi:putative ABC transport system ATP-binding protein